MNKNIGFAIQQDISKQLQILINDSGKDLITLDTFIMRLKTLLNSAQASNDFHGKN